MSTQSTSYTEREIQEKVQSSINSEETGYEQLYQEGFLNYRGKAKDSKREYGEVIAEYLLTQGVIQEIEKLPTITRTQGYRQESHDGVVTTGNARNNSARNEEWFAMDLFNASQQGKKFLGIGRVIDYQVPLKAVRGDKVGKVDLLSSAHDGVHLIELKAGDNSETLLRAALEIFTYKSRLDEGKLVVDYADSIEGTKDVHTTVLVTSETRGAMELGHIHTEAYTFRKKLFQRLGIRFYVMDQTHDLNEIVV